MNVWLDAAGAEGATVTDNRGIGSIWNNDVDIVMLNDESAEDVGYLYSKFNAHGFATIQARNQTLPPNEQLVIKLDGTTLDGSAEDGQQPNEDHDYDKTTALIPVVAEEGQTAAQIDVVGDAISEPDQYFYFVVSVDPDTSSELQVDILGNGKSKLTILNDDPN